MAYMPQDEVFLFELTPREHLRFMAQLQLHMASRETQHARVDEALTEMKLMGVADQLIGDPSRQDGLSRNERKRLNFATETLTSPSLLYVDEPTTGLDSVMAASVVKTLKEMASGSGSNPIQRTVIASIHQPSSDIYRMFDKLYFLVDGRMCYFGPTDRAVDYFAKLDCPVPLGINPADFIMDLVVDPANQKAAAARRERLCKHYSTTEVLPDWDAQSDEALAQVEGVVLASFWVQFSILFKRELVMRKRSPILTKVFFDFRVGWRCRIVVYVVYVDSVDYVVRSSIRSSVHVVVYVVVGSYCTSSSNR
jgi:ABC-type multidrug transport system ATPase subunit